MRRHSGVHAVLYALFDRSGRLDRGAMASQVERMRAIGVHGITVLGLATEVQKLSLAEQEQLVGWVAEGLDDQLPLAVTIGGSDIRTQRRMVEHALAHRAGLLILQPPTEGAGEDLVDAFLRVADGYSADFAVQNAPAYLGRSLSHGEIARLVSANPRFTAIKAETPAVDLAELVQGAGAGLTVLNGRGGLEMTDCLRAGAAGFILAPDAIDASLDVFLAWSAGDGEGAEARYRQALPAITFVMTSIEHLICYGKRIYGARTGTTIHDRPPGLAPTEFGIRLARRWARRLGPLGAPPPAAGADE